MPNVRLLWLDYSDLKTYAITCFFKYNLLIIDDMFCYVAISDSHKVSNLFLFLPLRLIDYCDAFVQECKEKSAIFAPSCMLWKGHPTTYSATYLMTLTNFVNDQRVYLIPLGKFKREYLPNGDRWANITIVNTASSIWAFHLHVDWTLAHYKGQGRAHLDCEYLVNGNR